MHSLQKTRVWLPIFRRHFLSFCLFIENEPSTNYNFIQLSIDTCAVQILEVTDVECTLRNVIIFFLCENSYVGKMTSFSQNLFDCVSVSLHSIEVNSSNLSLYCIRNFEIRKDYARVFWTHCIHFVKTCAIFFKIVFFLSSVHRVKLLLNRQTGEAVAMKMVDTKKHPDASASVKKEVCIQKFLQHANILRYFGTRRQNDIEYIFLEYAAGGELFDRIGSYIAK